MPAGTLEPDKFLFDKGNDGADRQEVAHRARVLQAGGRDLHRQRLSAGRQARRRRHLPGRRHQRGAGPRDQRVPGIPPVLPDQQARRLRAVQARVRALQADARAAARPDRDARHHQGA